MNVDRSKFIARLALAATFVAAGCVLIGRRGLEARNVRRSLRADALGCWVLFDQTGHTAQGSLYWAPAVANLRDERASSEPTSGAFRLVRLDSTGHDMRTDRERGFTYWSADSLTDSIRIGVSSGFSGTQLIFALPASGRARDTLHGRAYEHWDYKKNTNRGRAMAVRSRCPAPT